VIDGHSFVQILPLALCYCC